MKKLVPLLLAGAVPLMAWAACDSTIQGPDDDRDPDDDTYSHVRSTGASAPDFLADETFTTLVVEVDYMAGYAPDSGALDQLEAFLAERLNKATITIRTPTEIPAAGQEAYTIEEIRSIEDEHRDEFTDAATLAAYMLIVDGEFEAANILGVAHRNTSTAYLGAAFDAVSGGLTQPSRRLTEATVFQHEFGHLLGLVAVPGSGTDMQTEHQDEEHGHHCDDDRCLMYWAIESADLFGSILEGEVPELDANCLADLRANGGT